MGMGSRGDVLRPLQDLFRTGSFSGLSDGELLRRFTRRRDEAAEAAFAALVQRHGPAVLRLCRGVLRDPNDADDAFQATFLVLARRARSIRRREAVGPWLRAVALRVAGAARTAAARRRAVESRAEARPAITDGEPSDWVPTLLEELGRLPERFRTPLVLCYLEGITQEDAARQLGWPIGTVRSRLARGRERLRARLGRRGLAPAAGLGTIWPARSATAAPSMALAEATTRAAVRVGAAGAFIPAGVVSTSVLTLTEEVLRIMARTTLTLIGSSLMVGILVVAGAGVLARQVGDQPGTPAPDAPTARTPPADPGPASASRRLRMVKEIADLTEETRRLREQLGNLEATLERLRRELAGPEVLRDLPRPKGAASMPPPTAALSTEQRLQEIERRLDLLLPETVSARPSGRPAVQDQQAPPLLDDEDRRKAAAWAALTRDGFIGRFETGPSNSAELFTRLYRRYVGRRPQPDESRALFALFGPGYEQVELDPESFVRRLLKSESFARSPLGLALLGEPRTGEVDGSAVSPSK